MVGYQMIWNGEHFRLLDVRGLAHISYSHPTRGHCDPAENGCMADFTDPRRLPYCSEHGGGARALPHRAPCKIKDFVELTPGDSGDKIFVPTSVEVLTEARVCPRGPGDAHGCFYERLPGADCLAHGKYMCQTRGGEPSQFYYVADAERYDLRFTSSFERNGIHGTSLEYPGYVGVCTGLHAPRAPRSWAQRKMDQTVAQKACDGTEAPGVAVEKIACMAGEVCATQRQFDVRRDVIQGGQRQLKDTMRNRFGQGPSPVSLRLERGRGRPPEGGAAQQVGSGAAGGLEVVDRRIGPPQTAHPVHRAGMTAVRMCLTRAPGLATLELALGACNIASLSARAADIDAGARMVIMDDLPFWAGLLVSLAAKYLGFYIGPEAYQQEWAAAETKYSDRSGTWSWRSSYVYYPPPGDAGANTSVNYEPCNYTTSSEHAHHLDRGWIARPSAPSNMPYWLPKTYFHASGFTTYSTVVSSAPTGAFVQHVAIRISNISSVSAGIAPSRAAHGGDAPPVGIVACSVALTSSEMSLCAVASCAAADAAVARWASQHLQLLLRVGDLLRAALVRGGPRGDLRGGCLAVGFQVVDFGLMAVICPLGDCACWSRPWVMWAPQLLMLLSGCPMYVAGLQHETKASLAADSAASSGREAAVAAAGRAAEARAVEAAAAEDELLAQRAARDAALKDPPLRLLQDRGDEEGPEGEGSQVPGQDAEAPEDTARAMMAKWADEEHKGKIIQKMTTATTTEPIEVRAERRWQQKLDTLLSVKTFLYQDGGIVGNLARQLAVPVAALGLGLVLWCALPKQ
ncbi:unnamed protein product, partial [Prorocentrum cordatum]